MKKRIIISAFLLICHSGFGRENPIMENRPTSRSDKEYMEGVIPSDPEYVIPPVLIRTFYEDMHPEDRLLFTKAYSQDPEVATRLVAAQIAVYCWQQSDIEDHLGSEHFIASSLYELWQMNENFSLLWYNWESDNYTTYRAGHLLRAYTFLYHSSAEEIKNWIDNVPRKHRNRNTWAVATVNSILDKDDLSVFDIVNLSKITRNIYVYKTRDLNAFKDWWRMNQNKTRLEWSKNLIDKSLRILTSKISDPSEFDSERLSIMTISAVTQLTILLPSEIQEINIHVITETEDKDEILQILEKIEEWWTANRETYQVPLHSGIAL